MGASIQMTGRNSKTPLKLFNDLPKILANRLNNGNKEWCEAVASSLTFYAPESNGELKNSFSIDSTKSKGKYNQYKIVSNSPYAFAVNDGRAKGKAPPIEELMRWNKLDTSHFTAKSSPELSAAIALAQHISENGTQGTYFIEEAIEENLNLYMAEIELELDTALREAFK